MNARLLASFVFLVVPSFANAQDDFRTAFAYYKTCLDRPPMLAKTRGREALARTADPRAAKILAKRYRSLEAPFDRNRSIMVTLLNRHFKPSESVITFQKLMKASRGRKHAWLWFRGLQLQADQFGGEPVLAAFDKARDPFLKYAALQALFDGEYQGMEAVGALLEEPPTAKLEHFLLMGAVMEGLRTFKRRLGTKEYDRTLEAAIKQFDGEEAPRRSKIMMARYLGKIFNSKSRSIRGASWLRQMKAGRNKEFANDGYGTSFFNIRASGDRIAFVIDLSDSMLTPLPDKVRKRGGVTGVPDKKKKNDPFASEYKIPWHKVKNRFDLARENIKASLYSLKKGKSFAVIGFGEKASLLPGCSGMIPATKKNIKRVIRALNTIKPGPSRTDRPYGTLWGSTNLHGGLQRAFGVRRKGVVATFENTDEKALLQGADTIFVLSDGDPTWSDYDLVAPNYGEDTIGDPESRTPMETGTELHYCGPFRDWERLLDDAERMNLFRKAEIHCIGIGKGVQRKELKRLADLGLGQTKFFDL
ncbi:MAG: vWA domain-containing protein [Planctomycetota bacterium]